MSEGCCSTADGWKPEEVEYDMTGNKYRVKIEGEWYDVPRDALVEVPNRFGFPVVWYYKTWDNGIRPSISIRCFIPGSRRIDARPVAGSGCRTTITPAD